METRVSIWGMYPIKVSANLVYPITVFTAIFIFFLIMTVNHYHPHINSIIPRSISISVFFFQLIYRHYVNFVSYSPVTSSLAFCFTISRQKQCGSLISRCKLWTFLKTCLLQVKEPLSKVTYLPNDYMLLIAQINSDNT